MFRWLKTWAFFAAMSWASIGSAQVSPYTVTHATGTFNVLPTGTDHVPVAYGSQPPWDEGAAQISLPFSFQFFGAEYTEVWAYTNGFIAFQAPPSGQTILGPPLSVPDRNASIGPYIAPLWQDLDRDRNTSPLPPPPRIRTEVLGPSGQRQFVLEYTGFKRARSPLSDVSFKVVLHEGTQRVEVQYGPNFGLIDATAAVQGPGGQDGFNLHRSSASCTAQCPCGASTCSSNLNFPDGLVVTLNLPTSAELVGGITSQPGAAPGASFAADIVARNAGLVGSAAFDYEVFLSPSNTSLAGATRLASLRTSSALAALASERVTRTLTVPVGTPVSNFYLAVDVDTSEEVSEAIETNNLFFGTVFRTGPDLQGRSISTVATSGSGQTIPIELSIENEGAPSTAGFQVRFFLSQDEVIDAGDFDLGAQSVALLDGFSFSATLFVSLPANVPLSPPNYRVLARIDDGLAVPELNETNNVLSTTGNLQLKGPELTIASITSSPIMVRDRAYPIEMVVQNMGGAEATDFYACVLLSSDASFELASDFRLVEAGPLLIPAGESASLRLEPLISPTASAFDRFVAAAVDCRSGVAEGDETDNILPREIPVEVRNTAPDYRIESLTVSSTVPVSEAFPLLIELSNQGTSNGTPPIGLFWSEDEILDDGDELLVSFDGPELGPQASLQITGTATFPAELAGQTIYLFVSADPDDLLEEVSEEDNTSSVQVTVSASVLSIVSQTPSSAVIDRPYEWRFTAMGPGSERMWTFTWTDGEGPVGLSFDPTTATLSGTPAAVSEGFHPYRIEVRSDEETVALDGRLAVVPLAPALRVISNQLPPARAGEPYEHFLVASGGFPPYTWSLIDAALPTGLSFDNGRFFGQPGLPGSELFEVQVRDQFEQTLAAPVALEILDPNGILTITTAAVPSAVLGESYETGLSATGGEGLRWSMLGQVPGLSLGGSGRLSGVPTLVGAFSFTVRAEESATGRADTAAYVLEVFETGDLAILGEATLPQATLNLDYGPIALEASDTRDVVWSIAQGVLPPGITLSGAQIEGRPTEAGVFPFLLQVENNANEIRRSARLISVVDPENAPQLPDESGCRCVGRKERSSWILWGIGLVAIRLRRTRSS